MTKATVVFAHAPSVQPQDFFGGIGEKRPIVADGKDRALEAFQLIFKPLDAIDI